MAKQSVETDKKEAEFMFWLTKYVYNVPSFQDLVLPIYFSLKKNPLTMCFTIRELSLDMITLW